MILSGAIEKRGDRYGPQRHLSPARQPEAYDEKDVERGQRVDSGRDRIGPLNSWTGELPWQKSRYLDRLRGQIDGRENLRPMSPARFTAAGIKQTIFHQMFIPTPMWPVSGSRGKMSCVSSPFSPRPHHLSWPRRSRHLRNQRITPAHSSLRTDSTTSSRKADPVAESYILGSQDTVLIHVLDIEEIGATAYPIDLRGNLDLPPHWRRPCGRPHRRPTAGEAHRTLQGISAKSDRQRVCFRVPERAHLHPRRGWKSQGSTESKAAKHSSKSSPKPAASERITAIRS